jgi:hypothetical protein
MKGVAWRVRERERERDWGLPRITLLLTQARGSLAPRLVAVVGQRPPVYPSAIHYCTYWYM